MLEIQGPQSDTTSRADLDWNVVPYRGASDQPGCSVRGANVSTSALQLAVELVTRGIPCLRMFNGKDKEEVKVYEILADAFFVMQARRLLLLTWSLLADDYAAGLAVAMLSARLLAANTHWRQHA